jgi:hypothetical protein
MARTRRSSRASGAGQSQAVAAQAYTSPTLVLLAMDWPDGKRFPDFLGFTVQRSPGFSPGEKDGYLLNKIGFNPPGPNSQPLPSNVAPLQKFLWWDSGINDADRGKTFKYTITPVRGSGTVAVQIAARSAATFVTSVWIFCEEQAYAIYWGLVIRCCST